MIVSSVGRKAAIARAVGPLPLGALGRSIERRRTPVLVVNLHSVPPECAREFEELLSLLVERFAIADPFALEELATGGGAKPTLLLSFDDALANHAEVAVPILASRDARAIFAVPAAFPDVSADYQGTWFREHVYPVPTELHRPEELRAMSWDQLRELARAGHRLCSHGLDHRVLADYEDEVVRRAEVVESRAILERHLAGVEVNGFCWPVRAARLGSPTDALVRSAYDYALGGGSRALTTPNDLHRIPRLNIEVSWPRRVIELQLLRAALKV